MLTDHHTTTGRKSHPRRGETAATGEPARCRIQIPRKMNSLPTRSIDTRNPPLELEAKARSKPGQWPSMFSFTTLAGIPTTWV